MSAWNDQEAMTFAALAMRGKARIFFLGLTELHDFATLKQHLTARLGESQSTMLMRLEHRKQQRNESVGDYADAMRLLLAKTAYPPAGQASRFLYNLNERFRARVTDRMPQTLNEAIACALWHEDRDAGATTEHTTATEDADSGQPALDLAKHTLLPGLTS